MQEIVVIDGEITLENVLDGEVELNLLADFDPEVVMIVDGRTRYDITYNLATNIVSSNTSAKVTESSAYTTAISSNDADYFVGTITVLMGGVNITSQVVSDNKITIPSVTGDISITVTAVYYPGVVLESNTIEIKSGNTGTIKVKLRGMPTQNQTVSVYTESENITLSTTSLIFTSSNWDTYQNIIVTGANVDVTEYAYINLTNSDPMLTETTVLTILKPVSYEDLVDTTIPTTDQHVLTLSDFTSTSNTTIDGVGYVRLYGYNGAYSNVVMPAEMEGKKTLTCGTGAGASTSNTTFKGNTTIEYVTFEDGCRIGEAGAPSSNKGPNLFASCTNLIGVSNVPTSVLTLSFSSCTSLRFIDNLDELVNLTSLPSFEASGIQYIQDLSNLTSLAGVQATFKNSSLVKIFGLPELDTTTASGTNMYANCSALQYGIVPKGVSGLGYAFYNDSSLRRVDIFEDGLTTSGIVSTTFSGCNNLEVYCNANTTTHQSLLTQYGSSTRVTIKTFGSASVKPSIVVWGDSISSPAKSWIEWPKRLQTKLGVNDYLVKNQALAGEGSPSTTARQGGYEMTVDAFTIPATTTATEISITVDGNEVFQVYSQDVAPYAGAFSCGGNFNPCTISGVSGTISRDGSTYYFTRLAEGTAVNVSSGSVITSEFDTIFNNSDNVMLFYLNGNGGWHNDADVLLNMCQKAVDHFEDLGGTKYIIAGPAANVILTNESTKAQVLEFEEKAATAFGSHWLNLREYEIEYGLSQNNLTASELDIERMANGLVPASLVGGGSPSDIHMYDGVTYTDQNHPNVYGANTIMLAFYEKGVALGYWQ